MPLPDSSDSGFQGGLFPPRWTSLIAAHVSVVGSLMCGPDDYFGKMMKIALLCDFERRVSNRQESCS